MLFLLLLLYFQIISGSSTIDLKTKLLENYRKDTLPILNNNKINVSIGVALRALNQIDHISGQLKINLWLRYKWTDELLKWNDSIKTLKFVTDPTVSDSIWIPDIYLYNTGENPMEDLAYTLATVTNKGEVMLSRPGIITSTCRFNLSNFPYDQQYCHLKFGSWSHNANEIFLQNFDPFFDISNYQENEEWDLISFNSSINTKIYSCCPDPYQDITFGITIRRKSHYFNLNIILPAFTTASLMIMTFLIPRNSGERISFATTVMLSIVVFLLILSDNLPKTATSPLISLMFIGLLLFSLIGLFAVICMSALDDNIMCYKKRIEGDNLEISVNELENKKKYLLFKVELGYTLIFIIGFTSFIIAIVSMIPSY